MPRWFLWLRDRLSEVSLVQWLLGGVVAMISSWWGALSKLPSWLYIPIGLIVLVLTLSFIILCVTLYDSLNARRRLAKALRVKEQKSDIEIALIDGVAYESGLRDGNGGELPDAEVFSIRVTNTGNNFLQKCQIKFGQTEMFPVSGFFDLSPRESLPFPVLRVNHRQAEDPRAFVYFLRHSDWKITEGGSSWLPGPGVYDVTVFSSGTVPASLSVRLTESSPPPHLPREWGLSACG